MLKLLFLILISSLVSLSLACPDTFSWIPKGEKCYKLSEEPYFWNNAMMYCYKSGGYMAEITSKEETELIKTLIPVDDLYIWIGLTDEDEEGKWMWEDSYTPANYTNWGPMRPYQRNDWNCALVGDSNLLWYDYDCWLSMTIGENKPIHAFCEAENQEYF